MKYFSVVEMAEKWDLSDRTVRNYCARNKIPGAYLSGKTWNIPEDAVRPVRSNSSKNAPHDLLAFLRYEKKHKIKGGIYHQIQIDLTYNSNHIEGSKLTHEETRYIYETNTISFENRILNVDDIVETANHFRCVDMIIDQANKNLSESFIKELHRTFKNGTSDSRKSWFATGEYKKLPNVVGGIETVSPEEVSACMKDLLKEYRAKKGITFDNILEFHFQFECIHPFQDGNGRIGRLILFKECLKHNIVPFMIDEDHKLFYYRGLKEWKKQKGYLRDTCLSAQDEFKKNLDYFRIPYSL